VSGTSVSVVIRHDEIAAALPALLVDVSTLQQTGQEVLRTASCSGLAIALLSLSLGTPSRLYHSPQVLRDDAPTRIRCTHFRDPKFYEITGFVQFDKFIFFCVVITPANRKTVNLRKLEYVLAKTRSVNVKRDNTPLIAQLKQKKEKAVAPSVKGSLARDIAHYYRDMGMSEEAIPYLEESSALGLHYQGARDLLRLIIRHRPIEQVIVAADRHIQLDPKNPTVYNDIVDQCVLENRPDMLSALFTALKARNPSNPIIGGNLDFYMADSLIADGDFAQAVDFLRTAHQQLSTCLPKDHTVFKLIRKMENSCKNKSLRRGS
jgi:tetratricopeptide (TPR) repeat protein